jgi:hypothetical protein
MYPYGGHEDMFNGGRMPAARPDTDNQFRIELLNRLERPRSDADGVRTVLLPGQLVWKAVYYSDSWGTRRDLEGPFVILEQAEDKYVLITHEGFIHPVLISGNRLVPCVTTWHAMNIPDSLRDHRVVREVHERSRRQ